MAERNRASLAALLAVGIWLLAAAFLWLNLATPSDGARLQPGEAVWQKNGVVVTPLEETPGGLRQGDVVIAIDGRGAESWAQALFDWAAARPQWQFGQTITYTVLRNETPVSIPVTLRRYPLAAIALTDWSTILFGVFNQLVAAFVFFKRPADPPARILFLGSAGMLGATAWSLGLTVGGLVNPLGFWLFKALTVGAFFLFYTSVLHFALAFNKLRLAQAPRLIALLYAAPYAFYTLYVIAAKAVAVNALDWLRLWTPGEGIVPIVYLLLAIAAAIYGYRINRDPVVRQQLRWVLWAVMVSGGGGLILWNLPEYILGHKIIGPNTLGLIVLPFPIALAAAILRYRLFDIDIILNRTLVYGALTAGTMGIYVLIVGYLGDLFQARDRTAIAFLTTGLVAVIFQPLRERLQRAVNRLMYGERDEPYTILSRLGQRLKSTLAPDSILPTIVETVAQTLKLPYAAISLRDADTDKIAAAFGLPTPNTLALPLTYQHELIGHLHVAQRSANEPFTPAERRLLEDIARETEVAARAMRLTADLQRSRERLVTTREEERRRLRRDLHDGLGPTLASQSYKLDAVLDLMDSDPATARKLVSDLKSQAQTTLADIRRLIYELRPPALDEFGVVAALQAQFTDSAHGLRISVESPPDGLPPLSAAVEVAAYRIAMEAVNNATRHARARHCVIRFGAKADELTVEITDDGTGLQGGMRAGVGLTSMRERAAELGGQCVIDSSPKRGTRVCAMLPLAKEAP